MGRIGRRGFLSVVALSAVLPGDITTMATQEKAYIAVVDRLVAGRAVLLLESGGVQIGQDIVDRSLLPESAETEGAVLRIEYRNDEPISATYLEAETRQRRTNVEEQRAGLL